LALLRVGNTAGVVGDSKFFPAARFSVQASGLDDPGTTPKLKVSASLGAISLIIRPHYCETGVERQHRQQYKRRQSKGMKETSH
jgi:hypothetical protein